MPQSEKVMVCNPSVPEIHSGFVIDHLKNVETLFGHLFLECFCSFANVH